MDSSLSAETPCKVNLFLAVKGKRPDGYHLLDTVFYPLESGPRDSLTLAFDAAPGVEMSSSTPGLSGLDNLCAKAAKAYFEACDEAPRLKIALEKRIPVSAGLGGGSSDAAAALSLLNRRYGAFNSKKLHELASRLGADVSFFLDPKPSRAKGVGELLAPLPFAVEPLPLLLVFPSFPVSAAWAYKNLDWSAAKADSRTADELVEALKGRDISRLATLLRNDLSHAVRRKFPLIGMVEESLLEAGALAAQVSGSGSSVFGLFRDFETLSSARASLKAKQDWELFSVF